VGRVVVGVVRADVVGMRMTVDQVGKRLSVPGGSGQELKHTQHEKFSCPWRIGRERPVGFAAWEALAERGEGLELGKVRELYVKRAHSVEEIRLAPCRYSRLNLLCSNRFGASHYACHLDILAHHTSFSAVADVAVYVLVPVDLAGVMLALAATVMMMVVVMVMVMVMVATAMVVGVPLDVVVVVLLRYLREARELSTELLRT